MDWNSLANAATKKMQSFVSIVTDSNHADFIEREPLKHKILLFTDKKTTPAQFKALSKKYLNKLVMGEIRNSEVDLVKKYGVTSFPAVVALTDVDNLANCDKYTGELKVD
jgi:protein disulfide-isomerase A6